MHARLPEHVRFAPGVVKGRRRMSLSTEVMSTASFFSDISDSYAGVVLMST